MSTKQLAPQQQACLWTEPAFRLGTIGILLLSLALNLQLLDNYPLREDEAIYSYWALYLSRVDPWLLTVWPDKPPLFLWLQAGALQLFGATQAGARLLNIGITTATTALLLATGRRLWGGRGLIAAIFFALNPFTISFAATAYTDPLLVFWGQLALYWALRRRALPAGVALGAAIMTKQQGIFYLPLLLALIFVPAQPSHVAQPTERRAPATKPPAWLRFALGCALVVTPVLLWDSQRWAVAPSPWDLSVRNYGALTLALPDQWLGRAQDWWALLRFGGGGTLGWGMLSVLALLTFQRFRWHKVNRHSLPEQHLPTVLLLTWTLGFLLLHIVTTVQIWDRYLLPLIPMIALLLEGGGNLSSRNDSRKGTKHAKELYGRQAMVRVMILISLLLLVPYGVQAARGRLPLGGDHGAYSGLTEAVQWLQHERAASAAYLPFLLYQQPLGWQLQFYLFDESQSRAIEIRWFANAVTLADNAAKSPAHRRFLIAPAWKPTRELDLHLATRDLMITRQKQFGMMTLYEIATQQQSPCTWCLCQPNRRPAQKALPWQPFTDLPGQSE